MWLQVPRNYQFNGENNKTGVFQGTWVHQLKQANVSKGDKPAEGQTNAEVIPKQEAAQNSQFYQENIFPTYGYISLNMTLILKKLFKLW